MKKDKQYNLYKKCIEDYYKKAYKKIGNEETRKKKIQEGMDKYIPKDP